MGTLALPAYGSTVDVYHNDELRNVIILEQTGSPIGNQTMILWDDINTPDQQKLIDLVAQYSDNLIPPLQDPGSPTGSPFLAGSPAASLAGWHTVSMRHLGGAGAATGLANDTTDYSIHVVTTGSGSPTLETGETIGVVGSAVQTFATLATELDTAATTVTVTREASGDIRFENVVAGLGSTVELQTKGNLFNSASALIGFNGFLVKRAGVDTALEMFQENRNDGNTLFSDCYQLYVRPAKPPIGVSPNNINRAYFDGVQWLRLLDDAPISGI